MKRREFITVFGSAVAATAWPLAVHTQSKPKRVGLLIGFAETDPEAKAWVSAFVQGMRDLGWIDGGNTQFEYHWVSADSDRINRAVTELQAQPPDAILCDTSPVLAALHKATRAIPIVFANITDPVGAGFVTSLSHPGENITGFTTFEYTTAGKWLELLKEIATSLSRVAILYNPNNPQTPGRLSVLNTVASRIDVQITATAIREAAEIGGAISTFAAHEATPSGLLVLPDSFAFVNRESIISFAAKWHLPAVYPFRVYTMSGGLMSYGIDLIEQHRHAAEYVARTLKGEKPSDLPVQAPTKYELVINRMTAKALGLTIPPLLLATADEVIE